jgi:hypothetical protein
VAIAMTSGTGARLETGFASHGPGGTKAAMLIEPKHVLISAVRELARIGAIAGLRNEVQAAVTDAFDACTRDGL